MLIFVKLRDTKVRYVGSRSNSEIPRLNSELPTNYTYYTYITILNEIFLQNLTNFRFDFLEKNSIFVSL